MNLYDVYSLFDVAPIRGNGAYIYDSAGTEYLDFYGGHAVISIGHSHPHYISKLTDQLKNIGFYSNSVVNPLQSELASKLESTSGMHEYDLFLINSGAEANENALKLASFYNGRRDVLALQNSFHGRTSSAINITHTGIKHQAPINQGFNTSYCPYDDIAQIRRALESKKYTAFIVECIQGVGGLDMMSSHDLQSVKKICEETDTIFIADEIQCGYGRSGQFFAFQYADISPDLITMAKGMGNGFPLGGVLINTRKMPPSPGRLGTTYGGNHLACAAGIAVLDIINEENLVDAARQNGAYLYRELSHLRHVRQTKGRGLMLGVEFDFEVKEFRKKLVHSHHLFTGSSTNPNLLRILPPLNITRSQIDQFLDKMNTALNQL